MKHSIKQTHVVWAVGTALLTASLAFGEYTTSHTTGAVADRGTDTARGYTYGGPAQNNAAVPHPWSLTYASPGSDYYVRDMARLHSWEGEERTEEVLEWARTPEITIASK